MNKQIIENFGQQVTETNPRFRFRIDDHGRSAGNFLIFLWKAGERREDPVLLRDHDKIAICTLVEKLAEMLGEDLQHINSDRNYELTYEVTAFKK